VGDYVEIDLDCTRTQPVSGDCMVHNTNAIRKVVSTTAVVPSSYGNLTISTTPSSAAEVAGTVTKTMLDQADRTGADVQCYIEQSTGNINLSYKPKK